MAAVRKCSLIGKENMHFRFLFPHKGNIALRTHLAPAGNPTCFRVLFFTFWTDACIGGNSPPLHPHSRSSVRHFIHH